MGARSQIHLRLFCVACCAVVAIAAIGCKSNGNTELLERELRLQEDRIYELEDELDDKCNALEAARRENQSMKQSTPGDTHKSTGASKRPEPIAPPSLSVPEISVPSAPSTTGKSPSLELPPNAIPGDEAPRFEPRGTTPGVHSPDEPPPLFVPGGGGAPEASKPMGDANKITRLVLNRQLTGGWNNDGHRGDEGLFVAFQPQDAAKQPIHAIGDLSIVALDPTQGGPAGRVGRWDFTADEAAMHFHDGPLASGVQFELPWPSEPPVSRDLKIFVRMTKPDGEKVETDAAVKIIPMNDQSNRWTPKAVASKPAENQPGGGAKPQAAAPTIQPIPAKPMPTRPAQKTVRRPRWSPNR